MTKTDDLFLGSASSMTDRLLAGEQEERSRVALPAYGLFWNQETPGADVWLHTSFLPRTPGEVV